MIIKKKKIKAEGIKCIAEEKGEEIGSGFLYLLTNECHKNPFGFIESVFVNEEYRSQGIGTKLILSMLAEAKERKCYKVIMTSRYSNSRVHELYQKLGFKDWGKEFRIDYK